MQRFAFELRKLRAEAGGITYRVLARQAGYSVTTLSQAAAGEQLPTLPVVLAYAAACGGDPVEWEARWKQAVEDAAAGPADEGPGAEPPYRGLARFETGDSGRFFGRDALTADLLDLLRRQRFAAVFGPSGSGKSSLLRAGLIPALRHSREAGLRPATIRILTPGEHPARSHAGLLTSVGTSPVGVDTFVIVDQFEEVFTLCREAAERARFIDLLLTARRPGSGLRVLLAVRADFYGRCAEHRGLADTLRDANLPAGPMSPGELREAIVKPAAAAGLTVERALTARLVEEVAEEPGGLPLLSHVLLETWRRRRGKTLTLAGYEAAGGLDGAIAKTAEDRYRRFTQDQAAAARRMLLRLVTPGDGAQDTRRPVPHRELNPTGAPDADLVLEQLARARLITLDNGTVDLAHEAVITAWPRLRDWVETSRELLRRHRRLTEAATAWEELGRDSGALYRGTLLATAEESFTPEHRDHFTPLEEAFLAASLRARDNEVRAAARTTRRLRVLVASLSVLVVLAVTATGTAYSQRRSALAAQRAAVAAQHEALSRQLAAQSAAALDGDPELASLLAVDAYRTSPTREATLSLFTAAGLPLGRRLDDFRGDATSVAFSPDGKMLAVGSHNSSLHLRDMTTGRTRTVRTPGRVVAFSPDGRTLAAGGDDGTVRLTDTATDTPTGRTRFTLKGHEGPVGSVAFSPDGGTLATSGFDGTVRLWDTATGRTRTTLKGHKDSVWAVAFSPDGRTLASGAVDNTVRLWDTATGRPRTTLEGHKDSVWAVAFSPDGRTLASGGADGTVRLWDTATGRTRTTVADLTDKGIKSLAYSPDGRTLAVGSDTVNLLDRDHGLARSPLVGHTAAVLSVAFSPDGDTLATVGMNETVRLWDVSTRARGTLTGHRGAVRSIAFSAAGTTLVTSGDDGTVRQADVATGRAVTTGRASTALGDHRSSLPTALSPDGRFLAVGTHDRTVQLKDLTTGRIRTLRTGHEGPVRTVAFSPDGGRLATGSDYIGTVRIQDATTGRTETLITGYDNRLTSLAFSPDGRLLAVGGQAVDVRDTATGRVRTTLKDDDAGGLSDAKAMAFSPDSAMLATIDGNGRARLWDAAAGRRLGVLEHQGPVASVAFSPDGRTLAAGGDDGTVELWDVATRYSRVTLTGHDAPVTAMEFSPDGHTLATGDGKGTTRLWDAALPDPAATIDTLCRTVRRGFTAQEQSLYFPDRPTHRPCDR